MSNDDGELERGFVKNNFYACKRGWMSSYKSKSSLMKCMDKWMHKKG